MRSIYDQPGRMASSKCEAFTTSPLKQALMGSRSAFSRLAKKFFNSKVLNWL